MQPTVYARAINNLGIQYNTAGVLVESNDIGSLVVNDLNHEYEYDNLISETTTKEKYVLGVRTTKLTKRVGCSVLKEMLESQKLIIQDNNTLIELANFIAVGNSYRAETGCTDDIVMTLVMLAWYTTSVNFEYISDINISDLYTNDISKIDDLIVPFMVSEEPAGYYEDGDYWVKH
jgi:hypothetical protein